MTVTVYVSIPVFEMVPPLVTDEFVPVYEIPGPENVYDLILLPVPAEHPETLTINLFFIITKQKLTNNRKLFIIY